MRKLLRRLKLLLAPLLVILWLVVSTATPALAIADPDTPPSINGVYVYNDLLEEGDAGVLLDYYLDYDWATIPVGTPVPDETVTEAFMTVFIDIDGITQLKTTAPYTFINSGYGRGISWIYFTAAEVTTHFIDIANEALYSEWLVGNPTLDWDADPPKTTGTIDYWQPAGTDTAVLLALRVLYFADQLELAWSLDLIEETPLGNRLTALGESYFSNAIPYLRDMAPSAFSAGTIDPTLEDLDYSTSFGATIADGATGTIAGSPVTLVEESNTITLTGAGDLLVELTKGTEGTVTSGVGGAIVAGSPVSLTYIGTNTITVAAGGTQEFDVTVNLTDTQTAITDTVTGTGFDLTTAATAFGMTRIMFSGLVWLVVSVIICSGVYKASSQGEGYGGSGGKLVLLIFDICIVGGAVLGLLPLLVAALMFVGFGVFTGYIIFFRGASV